MKLRRVVVSPEARDDLLRLYDRIADAAGPVTALGFVERLEAHCARLDLASERGRKRDDIRVGLRIVGFERRIAIAIVVDESDVTILRLFYGGQDWEAALS